MTTKIYIQSKHPDDMIRELNQKGIRATDCSVCAEPQIYDLIVNGKLVHNYIITSDNSYVFQKSGQYYELIDNDYISRPKFQTVKSYSLTKDIILMIVLLAILTTIIYKV